MLRFFRNLLGVKTDQAVQSAIETLVRWDPKGATEAELRTMEQRLDELGLEVAHARTSYEKEKQEAVAIKSLLDQRMAAAELLQTQIAAETDPGHKSALEKSLGTLLDLLEKMTPDVERESRDEVDAQEFLGMLEQAYAEAGEKLKMARGELERAEREMKRAEQQREQAERQTEAARHAAGLSKSTSGLSVALKAMKETAERDLATAEAAQAKARLLKPTHPEQDDPNIAAALAASSGALPLPQSPTERLAAIKSRIR